jgi:hypothetical protein
MTTRTLLVPLLLALAMGCGGKLSDLEGVYTIDTWTNNPAGCGAEGPSVLSTMPDKALFLKEANFLGEKFLNGVTCKDVADCQSKAKEDTIFLGSGWAFESGDDTSGWKGTTTFASGTDTCSGTVTDHVMTSPAKGTLRIESSSRMSKPFNKDSEGFCNTDDAKKAAEGQPCMTFEVVTATFNVGI